MGRGCETFEKLVLCKTEDSKIGAAGNSSGCENAMIRSHKCAHVLLPTGDVTLLPEVSAQGCRFNLKPQMFLGRV